MALPTTENLAGAGELVVTSSMASLNLNLAAAYGTNILQKLNEMTTTDSADYDSWRKLVSEIETASPDDIDAISLAYDSLLSKFPLCNWHLEKYVYHKAKMSNIQEAITIFEHGAATAMFSIGFWVDYFTFCSAFSEDPVEVRRLFGRAMSFIGKDYFCHILWDNYMKYEFNQGGWNFLAQGYIQALRFPSKKLHFYYDNFKQFIANLEEEIGYERDNSTEVKHASIPCSAIEVCRDEISIIVKDLLDASELSVKFKALRRYKYIGEEFYQRACQMDDKIKIFEMKIQRQYFYLTPLDDDQLNNWHLYLDFIEKQDDLDWAMKLYERCLIPCAHYPEFWMRYVEFLESKGGRELAISSLARATKFFLKDVPDIHLFSARFKEHIGDFTGARTALLLCDTKTDSIFMEKVRILANLERRLGNVSVASDTYQNALKTAREKRRLHVLPSLYSDFSLFTFLITGSAAAARDVLIEGVQNVPHCRFLLEELIKFSISHEEASQVNIIDSIIADAISPRLDEYGGLNAKDREGISCLFIEDAVKTPHIKAVGFIFCGCPEGKACMDIFISIWRSFNKDQVGVLHDDKDGSMGHNFLLHGQRHPPSGFLGSAEHQLYYFSRLLKMHTDSKTLPWTRCYSTVSISSNYFNSRLGAHHPNKRNQQSLL